MTKQKHLLLALAILLTTATITIALLWWLRGGTPQPEAAPPSNDTVTTTVDTPSEARPADTYSVSDGQPLSVTIASAGIKGYIQKVGIDQHKAVAAPNNIHMAGWFVDSVLPGQKGLSIIDGHEGGPTMDGIFKRLPDVKPGDKVIVTMGGGTTHTYTVFDVKVVDKDQAAAILFDQSPTATNGQLNLITCTGTYNDREQTYDKRAVVYAGL